MVTIWGNYLLNVSVEGASQLDKVLITWAVMIKVYYAL